MVAAGSWRSRLRQYRANTAPAYRARIYPHTPSAYWRSQPPADAPMPPSEAAAFGDAAPIVELAGA
jgi:hypothetical protein